MSYCNNYMSHVRVFCEWLVKQKGYTHIHNKGITLLYLTQNERNEAKMTGIQKSYLIHKLLSTARNMQRNTEIEMRDSALFSLCTLTTPRITALINARISSIEFLEEYNAWAFIQKQTKKRRLITAFFIGQNCENIQDIVKNVLEWKEYLVSKGFTQKDPLFPQMNSTFTKEGLHTIELNKISINSDSWVRESVFKKSFINNRLKYINPHNFRHTLARAVKKMPNGVELSIALAQNFGQKNEMPVLYSSYGGDYIARQVGLLSNYELE